MNPVDWQRIKDLFAESLDQPAETRERFLKDACGGQRELFDDVVSLLAASTEPENLLEINSIDLAGKIGAHENKVPEQHFGNFRIVREIGSGGMGTVFLAERNDGEFVMQVALKIVRQSVADREIIERFRRERQILADLQHPNIAVLHDGGLSEKGEPYLAMEFIDGETLIDYANAHKLSIDDRIRLLIKVCSAVAFAHRNLIVHRDIKPSNILVGADGEPKLLDFGLAKSFASEDSQVLTTLRAFTPAYASPEQITGGNITTASDIYSLGVVLYELLTGSKPLKFDDKSFEEIVQTVISSEPRPPSEASPDGSNASENRKLRGDLDNIALMALRKEPDRRYASVEEFAEDIKRHLAGRPIIARKNTFGYRSGKFIRRNIIPVTAAALILIALTTGMSVSLWQAKRARRESSRSQEANQFLRKMLLTAIPGSGGGGRTGAQATMLDVLKEAERRLESDETYQQDDLRAELHQLIGEAYFTQGMYDDAERNLRRAMDEQSRIYGRESPHTITVEYDLARLYQEKGDYDTSYEIYQRRLDGWRSGYQQGSIEPQLYVTKLTEFAAACRARSDPERAEQLLREALDTERQLSLDPQLDYTSVVLNLILLDQGRFTEAKNLQKEALARARRSEAKDNPALPLALTLMGSILTETGEVDEAEKVLDEGESIYRKLFGPEYLGIYDNIRVQAQVAYLQGDYKTAKSKVDLALEKYRKNSIPKNISFATALTLQGLIENKIGRPDEAEKILREALKIRLENLSPDHFMTALTKGALGDVLLDQKRYSEAEPYIRESLDSLAVSQKLENNRLTLARDRLARLESRQ